MTKGILKDGVPATSKYNRNASLWLVGVMFLCSPGVEWFWILVRGDRKQKSVFFSSYSYLLAFRASTYCRRVFCSFVLFFFFAGAFFFLVSPKKYINMSMAPAAFSCRVCFESCRSQLDSSGKEGRGEMEACFFVDL